MNDEDHSDKIWIDGPMHPDLFDGETPIREMVDLHDCGLRVYKVQCTYFVPEEQTHFVVATNDFQAEDIAWNLVGEEPTSLDTANVEEMSLDDRCNAWSHSMIVVDTVSPTARDVLVKHVSDNGLEPMKGS